VRRIVPAVIAAAVLCAGCGSSATHSDAPAATTVQAHPQAVEPVAGIQPSSGGGGGGGSASVSVGPPSSSLPQPASTATIRSELAASGISANPNQATLTPDLLAIAPIGAPAAVQSVINAGNEIAHLPYIWGGGHMTYEDTGYDCSGSISFVLAAAGLLNGTETSGQLMSWGKPGPGKWITVYATQGHTFMYVAGLRFDTVALAHAGSRWSNRAATEGGGFVARHPVGL
jgi:cell wall-associated NlpC family hydrolase